MSIRDLNKVIHVYSALNGDVIFSMDYDDFIHCPSASDYLYSKIYSLLDNEEGCIVKIGYKN